MDIYLDNQKKLVIYDNKMKKVFHGQILVLWLEMHLFTASIFGFLRLIVSR